VLFIKASGIAIKHSLTRLMADVVDPAKWLLFVPWARLCLFVVSILCNESLFDFLVWCNYPYYFMRIMFGC
jgi:hypothetical protein